MITQATITVMESYNYNNFTISVVIQDEKGITDELIDSTRKDLQKLTNKAVNQYKQHKNYLSSIENQKFEYQRIKAQAERIIEHIDPDNRNPEQKAIVQKYNDFQYERQYNYEDDDLPY